MYQIGDRVELTRTSDPYTNLRPGARGRVTRISTAFEEVQVSVRWDDGSTLSLLPFSGDGFRVIPDETHLFRSDGERLICWTCEAGKGSSAGSKLCPAPDQRRLR